MCECDLLMCGAKMSCQIGAVIIDHVLFCVECGIKRYIKGSGVFLYEFYFRAFCNDRIAVVSWHVRNFHSWLRLEIMYDLIIDKNYYFYMKFGKKNNFLF